MFDLRQNAEKNILCGNKLYLQKKYRKALKFYIAALKHNRNNVTALINCANCNFMLNKYSKTIYYINLLKNKFNFKNDLLVGQAYFETEDYAEAAECFENLIEQNQADSWVYNWLSQCCQKLSKPEEAIKYGFKAVELSDGKDVAHQLNLGYLLYEISLEQNTDIVLKYAEKWLKKYPDNQLVEYMAGAIVGKQATDSNGFGGIREIFDAFAPEFEKTLSDLSYQTPEIVAQILRKHKIKKTKVLDLGCGTGLCGKYLKEYASFGGLIGIDISANMLKEAEKKHIYFKLINSDAESSLSAKNNVFGLICAADVLTYFSELDNVFSKACNALKQGGYFIFSITENSGAENFVQHRSGRFQHSERYIVDLAEKNNFTVVEKQKSTIRTENGAPVKGIVFLLCKNK